MTVNSLINQLYERLYYRIKKHELRWIINFIIDEINKSLSNGEDVKLKKLGTFKLKHRKSKVIKLPKDQSLFKTKDHYIVQFIASKILKRSVAKYKKIK
ncbi:HU family DNA-binding protein [Spirochaetota bacterium]